MNKQLTAILAGGGIALLAFLLLKFLFSSGSFVALLVGVLLGGGVAIFMIARSRGERPQDVAQEVVDQVLNPDPDALKYLVEEQLLRLNHRLRKETTVRPVILASEEVIDLLLEVVPRAMSESPNSEAAFDLEKLSTDYLPELLGNYLGLSGEDQASEQENLLKQISDLAETIRAAEASLNEGNLDDFQISSSFLKAKTA